MEFLVSNFIYKCIYNFLTFRVCSLWITSLKFPLMVAFLSTWMSSCADIGSSCISSATARANRSSTRMSHSSGGNCIFWKIKRSCIIFIYITILSKVYFYKLFNMCFLTNCCVYIQRCVKVYLIVLHKHSTCCWVFENTAYNVYIIQLFFKVYILYKLLNMYFLTNCCV